MGGFHPADVIPISKPFIGDEECDAVLRVLKSGFIVEGKETKAFEEEFAAFCGVKHAVATNSGTTALHAALLAHGIGPGDEVITTPFTFIASVNSIIFTGARPVFADILPETYNIDPDSIRALITPKTKAIMPVHLYGLICDMEAIQAIADEHGVPVIEDAAQAIGATRSGKRAGSFGTGCFSLYATKNVMCGEGGMITTNDKEIATRARLIRSHGSSRRYYHDTLGYNYRMMDLTAAIGRIQLQRFPEFHAARQRNARYLNENLKSVITPRCFAECRPTCTLDCGHAWHQYTVRVESDDDGQTRDAAVAKLSEMGIGTGIFYPVPANRQKHIQDLGLGDAEVTVAERISRQVFSLPVHPQLSHEDLKMIVEGVNSL